MARAKMGASFGWEGNYVESATASFSLEVGDSGKTFILKDAAVTVTLPTLSDIEAGYSITLISGDDSEHIIAGGASKIYGQIGDRAGGNFERINAASGYTLGTALIGDRFELTSDGTNWYMFCITGVQVVGS